MASLTSEYALRALLVLAGRERDHPVSADAIAAATGAPRNYMGKVLHAVARAGLVVSARGPAGGFALAVPAKDITLDRVFELFEQDSTNSRCMLGNGPCDPRRPCAAHEAWKAVTRTRRVPLVATTLEDLLEGRVAPFIQTLIEDSLHVT